MITIIIDIGIAICGVFFGMALFSRIEREYQKEESEKYKNALEKIKERVQLSLNKADSYVILKIINEVLDKNNEKNKKLYGFKIGKHIVDIESHSEQEAFRLLGVNFWHLISGEEMIELLGELKKYVEPAYKKDKSCEIYSKIKDNKIEIVKTNIY